MLEKLELLMAKCNHRKRVLPHKLLGCKRVGTCGMQFQHSNVRFRFNGTDKKYAKTGLGCLFDVRVCQPDKESHVRKKVVPC